jgi:hypothetical protein
MGGEQGYPDDLNDLDASARAIANHDDGSDKQLEIIRRVHARTDRPAFDAARALVRPAHPAERVPGPDIPTNPRHHNRAICA